MSLNANRARLMAMTKELMLKWEHTRNYWKDSKSLEFEKRYLEPLLLQMDKTGGVSEKLDAIISKARKECE
jgi:hypothetical protein